MKHVRLDSDLLQAEKKTVVYSPGFSEKEIIISTSVFIFTAHKTSGLSPEGT